MRLPESARALWTRLRPILHEELNRLPHFDGWCLTGGTILAARWNHRRSTDLDVTISPRANPQLLTSRHAGTFEKSLASLGALRTRYHHQRRQLIVVFDDESRLDIVAARPRPRHGAAAEPIEGINETVLSNAQILHGKLRGRGTHAPTRDLYDFAVADDTDPEALEIALNMLHPNDQAELQEYISRTRADHARRASRQLIDPDPRWHRASADPAGEAAQALHRRRYQSFDLHLAANRLTATAVCNDGAARTRTHDITTNDELTAFLDRNGILAHADSAPTDELQHAIRAAFDLAAPAAADRSASA